MYILDTFISICNSNDKEWLFRACANKCLGHAIQVQKRKSHEEAQQEEQFREVSGHAYKKDNLAELGKWVKVLNDINMQNDSELVKEQRAYLTKLNENPSPSEKDIERWEEATRPMFDTDEEAREYAIEMLNQQAYNSAKDWHRYGLQAEVEVLSEITHGGSDEYPDDLAGTIASRLAGMIRFIDRKPSLQSMGKRFELVTLKAQIQQA
jgi:hypothetical protein